LFQNLLPMKATITFALFILGTLVASATSLELPKYTYASAPALSAPASAGIFSTFQAHRKQNGVALAWTVNAAVEEFVIERSYDGSYFETLDHVPPATGARNRYDDNTVLPGYIYYRAKAVLADGTVDYSATVMVRIVRHG
jgi:hypothetical protein